MVAYRKRRKKTSGLSLLVVGCGDVARRALPLVTARLRVYALVRTPDAAADVRALGATPILGDLDQPRSLRRLAGLASCLWHFAPPPGDGAGDPRTRRLIGALGTRGSLPRRVVYIGTTGVYGDCGGARIDETRPLRPQSARAARRVDAERRMRGLARRGVRVAVLRAPGIYAGERLPLERLRRGDPALRAGEDSHSNHIHADDLARLARLALFRGAAGRVYNACDDSDVTMGDWFDMVADACGLPRPPRISRADAEQRLTPLMWSFMRESRRISNRRIKHELRVRLRYPTVREGLAAACAALSPEPVPCSS